ncbi:MAG: hypothetical protein AB1714_15835 [Acidobacteriota bacterium]
MPRAGSGTSGLFVEVLRIAPVSLIGLPREFVELECTNLVGGVEPSDRTARFPVLNLNATWFAICARRQGKLSLIYEIHAGLFKTVFDETRT